MILHWIDWIIISLYFILVIAIAIYMSKRAGKSTGEFFLTGRNLPWWIAGTSMVATTFAADTPLAVTELVAENGIAGNWLWWNMMIGGMLTVFFFARLWRRAGILTDCEFVSIRYSGKTANFLRGFRAIYIGIIMNVVVIAWVNLAMVKILTVIFPELTFFGLRQLTIPGFTFNAHLLVVGGIMIFVAVYAALSGLWGVSLSDAFQFLMAMTGCIILAVIALNQDAIGGVTGLREKLPEWVFKLTPSIGDKVSATTATGLLKLSAITFVTYIAVQWWASWYPGAEPGGGGYVAQRMMSAKDEKHALGATLWFQIAHYALRPWPWILVALCTLIFYPDLAAGQKGDGFIMVIRDVLPTGLIGLLLAAFFAAYTSTISSQTVWGTSYIVNDLYKPFLKPGADERYYVKVSRVTTFLLIILSLFVTSKLERISDAWRFILEASGGMGLVLILRWFWWRINAWSEIAAIVAPFAIYPVLKFGFKMEFPYTLLTIVALSTVVWLVVTYLTRPTDEKTLVSFYRKVHPGGAGWKKIAVNLPDVKGDKGYGYLFVNWFTGCILVVSSLFFIGKLIFGQWLHAVILFGIMAVAGIVIYRNMGKMGWEKLV
jgi:Na+/proline symporter